MRNGFTKFSMAALVALVAFIGTANAYTLTGFGADGGWKNSPITTVFDESDYTLDDTTGNVDAALQLAFDTWADVDLNDDLEFNRLSDGGGNYDVYDGPGWSLDPGSYWNYANITIGGWRDAAFFEEFGAGGGTGILAVSITSKLKGAGKPQWTSDIYLNDYFAWSSNPGAGEIDIETVVLHEAGHSLGFGHEDSLTSVMQSYYFGVNRDLYDTDIDGAIDLYGSKKGGGGGGGGGGGNGGGPGGGGPPGRNLVIGVTLVDGYEFDFFTAATPEPSTFAMTLLGLLSLGVVGWRRRRRA